MSDNESPKPGSAAYDQMMAERYRAQRDGVRDVPLTSDGAAASSYDHIVDESGAVRVSIRRDSTLGPAHQPERYSATMADPAQVAALEQQAERIRGELAEAMRYDPRTGEAVPRYTGDQRKAREIRLEHLEKVEIPGVRQLQAQAAAWRSENVPTTLQLLSEERDRRERLAERAQAIADEREAQALAERIAAQRRSRG